MTVRDLALILLRDLGIVTLVPSTSTDNTNTRGVGAGDLNAVAAAINAAFSEIFQHGPSAISERQYGGVLNQQTNVTLGVTQYSTAITSLTTYASWMLGCTLRIGGDTGDNELYNQTTLIRPYMGTTGTVTAQVWGDAIRLDPSISHVLDPVTLPNFWQLRQAVDLVELLNTAAALPVRTPQTRPMGSGTLSLIKRTGLPECYLVNGQFEATTTYQPLYIRFAPMPSQTYPCTFRVKLRPPVFTSADIDNGDHTTDPGTILPASDLYDVLIPYCRQRLASDPLFNNERAAKAFERDYKAARAKLENSRPGIGLTIARYQ